MLALGGSIGTGLFVASGAAISYWFPDIPGWYWSALFLALLFFINFAKETPSFIS